jgi:hypothetical protein
LIGKDQSTDLATLTETTIAECADGYFIRVCTTKRGAIMAETMVYVRGEPPPEFAKISKD